MSVTTLNSKVTNRQRALVFANALAFVVGFSLIFIVGWGGAATVLGSMFAEYKSILARVGGVVVIIFGLFTLDLIKIPWLYYDTRPAWMGRGSSGLAASGLLGVFFASGWSPCIGTSLGAILTLGLAEGQSGQAMILSSGYALGMSVPFLLIALGLEGAAHRVRKMQPLIRPVQIASGLLMILLGVMLLTNTLTWIAIWGQRNGLFVELPLGMAATPNYWIAVLAGLISFLSPCVLPLVPAYIGHLSAHALQD